MPPKAEVKKKPRQKTFDVMEDAQIKEIEDLALDYADVRDTRIKLGVREGELKQELHDAMKKNKKEKYIRGRIEVEVTPEQVVAESVKVRIAQEPKKKEKAEQK